MNFFQHQDAARRKTGRLILLFALAVAAIVGSIYFIVVGIYAVNHAPEGASLTADDFVNPSIFGLTSLGVGLTIAAGSLYRIATLSGGGKTIAEMLGGRLLDGRATDWRERRMLNVVEEMAIASGMPVPPVYVMDRETGINAFAAGFTPVDAVIGVTRGTMESLTRDELQGVVAHEFSHILHGDMRLNIRLMGVLHGILLISLIGYFLFRAALEVRPSSSRSSSDKGDGGAAIVLFVIAVGLALYVLGYIGVFFGHLIKSAVSRQREYLADASAVQFTRNPEGITGALRKIGAIGSRFQNANAEQASHMYFGNGVATSWLSLLATHPPLVDRIKRLDPRFDGDFSRERLSWPEPTEAEATPGERPDPPRSAAQRASSAAVMGNLAAGMSQLSAEQAVADVGHPTHGHLLFAANFLRTLPDLLTEEVHDPIGAACTVFALLLHADPSDDEPMLEQMRTHYGKSIAERTARILEFVKPLSPYSRLPLAQLTMTALRQLTPAQFDQFRRLAVQLVKADRHVSLFEFCMQRMILKHLSRHFADTPPEPVLYKTLDAVAAPTALLLGALAHAGHPQDQAAATAAYRTGCSTLAGRIALPALGPAEAYGFGPLDEALRHTVCSSGAVKQQILEACAATIEHDGKMKIDEAELLRTIADALDSPMPPPAVESV
jgi:Zn-dependent protease with chaperone function